MATIHPPHAHAHAHAHDPCGRERAKRSIASQLEGALLISRKCFPYLMLIASEAGSPFRALLLLLISPILCLLDLLHLEDIALGAMIFVSTAGLRVADVKAVSRATLPNFFLHDVRESAHRLLSRCGGHTYVVTCIPRVMVEPFLRDYLEVDHVIGTELTVLGQYLTGLVSGTGIMGGALGLEALRAVVDGGKEIDVGLADGLRDHPFMLLCKERYLITPEEKPSALPQREFPKPLIFHDGRFAVRPTPLVSLAVALWLPMGILFAICRILVGLLLPYKLGPMGCAAIGIRIRAQIPNQYRCSSRDGKGKGKGGGETSSSGKLYVCSHRTLLDPVFISIALQQRWLSAVTYSLSRLSEVISPIPTVRLTRERSKDRATMRWMLQNHGDVVVCPEGTTCREPYLMRFSPLFAEITDDIVPVAVVADGSMFYGTTVRGYKCLDSFFFLMNPIPCYHMQFLVDHIDHLAGARAADPSTCRRNKYFEVANQVQESIGRVLGFKCTTLTRKDKYQMLAGNDGLCLQKQTCLQFDVFSSL